MISESKNWFGMTPHTTDNLIHWDVSKKDAIIMATAYRTAYDKIVAAGLEGALKQLMRASYTEGSNAVYD